MSDLAKCRGLDCSIRDECRRFTAPEGGYRQYWLIPTSPGPTCDKLLPNKRLDSASRHAMELSDG
jgi:hypothetical protein